MLNWNRKEIGPSHHAYGQQYVLRRSLDLLSIPAVLLVLLVLNLAWQIVRTSASPLHADRLPWRVELLDTPPTVALIAVTCSVIALWLNLTHTSRPRIGYGDNPANDSTAGNTSELYDLAAAREMHFYNAGPGTVDIESIKYALLLDRSALESEREWLTESAFRVALSDNNFVEHRDFVLPSTDTGAPLPVVKGWKEGFMFLALSEEAALRIAGIDVRLRVRDGIGNVHERVLRVVQSLERNRGQDAVYKEQARLRRSSQPTKEV